MGKRKGHLNCLWLPITCLLTFAEMARSQSRGASTIEAELDALRNQVVPLTAAQAGMREEIRVLKDLSPTRTGPVPGERSSTFPTNEAKPQLGKQEAKLVLMLS